MIRCDYCQKRIQADKPYQSMTLGDELVHYHSDSDRADGDCAGLVFAALATVTGDRPPVPSTP